MNDLTDQQLLRDYAERRSEPAFVELVRRHVDFVYSAALRMVRDAHLAEDVTQAAFLALAKNARQLVDRPVLSWWLHRTAQNLAAKVVRSNVRRCAREQEAAIMNELLANAPEAGWENIAPQLDEALAALNEPDRDALFLRYFERKSAREIAQVLGTTEEAAQKRVSRAVERLREFFAKRGLTIGASGLVVLITANAVQAAPAGLAASISAAVVLTGTAVAATATATKAIAMTTLQKTLVTTTVALLAGLGLYETRRAETASAQIETIRQQQAPLTAQIKELQRERDDAMERLAALQTASGRAPANSDASELLQLRAEVTRLRAAQRAKPSGLDPNDPNVQDFLAARTVAEQISAYLEKMPDKKVPELKLLTDIDWLTAAKAAKFDNDGDVRETLSHLRRLAKGRLPFGRALSNFIRANNGDLPADLAQLKPYVKTSLGEAPPDDATLDAIFERYQLLHTGKAADLPQGAWIVVERAPVDAVYDSRAVFGNGTSTIFNNGAVRSYSPTGE